jgi:hypothetical protein
MNEAWLIWGTLFGAIGLGMLIYGRKQKAPVAFICGLSLIAFPYFVSETLYLILIGTLLILASYFIKI